jgi:hypothetical protein
MLSRRWLALLGLILSGLFVSLTLGTRLWLDHNSGPDVVHIDVYVHEGAKMEIRDGKLIFHSDPPRGWTLVHPLTQNLMIGGLFVVALSACVTLLWTSPGRQPR